MSEPDVLRHSPYTRFVHWGVALFFLLAALSGFTDYFPKAMAWVAPLFGGRKGAQFIHPWFSLGFEAFLLLQFFNWYRPMLWRAADNGFIRHLTKHILPGKEPAPPDTGFFNGGQKLYFWFVIASAVVFLGTGLVWWFKSSFSKELYEVCRTIHRLLAFAVAAGLLVHIYKATLGEPGVFRSMLRGTVTAQWARTRRPGWLRDLRGGH